MKAFCFIILIFVVTSCAHASSSASHLTCDQDPKRQKKLSAELKTIVQQDQADRALPYDQTDWSKVSARDLQRRLRVAAIFAEGCFKEASDYASAALVYQHGTAADHFYQTFLWASRAVELGDESRRWLVAAGLDRYLVKLERKQLFGTQFGRAGTGPWCIQPVEPTFPEKRRLEYIKKSLNESIDQFIFGMKLKLRREDIRDCEPKLSESPRGSVPGFW
jgi:hypothetical protein